VRRRAFNIALVVSLAMLALCVLGFVGTIGAMILHRGSVATSFHSIAFERGRFAIYTETWSAPPPVQSQSRFSIDPVVRFRLRFPKIDGHAFSGFDAHPLPSPNISTLYVLACPLWALALPFLIAPTIWLRRRLAERRRQQHGFPVNSTEPEPQPQ
jgi:hypothetical protein